MLETVNPVVRGLLNGFAIAQQIRQSALEREQIQQHQQSLDMQRQQMEENRARQQRADEQADFTFQSKLADMGVRPATREDEFAASLAKVPRFRADASGGMEPIGEGISGSDVASRMLKYRGQGMVLPTEQEKIDRIRRAMVGEAEAKQLADQTMREKFGQSFELAPGYATVALPGEIPDLMQRRGAIAASNASAEAATARTAATLNPKPPTAQTISTPGGTYSWVPGQATATPITTPGGQPIAHPPASSITDSRSAAAEEELAQSLARGELTRLKDVISLRGRDGGAGASLRIFHRARQLNPNFNSGEIERKIKMESDYTTGAEGRNIQSLGIFLEHAGAANDQIQAVRQTNSALLNRPLNWWKQNVSGDPTFQAFMVSLEPVRKEFEQFLLGGKALYVDDRKAAEKILSDSSSMAQIQSALKQMGHTAKARANELNYRYKRVMKKDFENMYSPEAIEGAAKIGVDLAPKPASTAAQPGRAGTQPAEMTAINPQTGQRIVLRGGKWVPIP